MRLNDIFTEPYFEKDKDQQIEHNDYTSYAQWANDNGYIIQDLDTKDEQGHRQFTVVEPSKPSQDELELQKTTAKQSELQSQLNEIMTAHNQAVMLGDTALADELKTEYQSLVNGSTPCLKTGLPDTEN